jgi:Domain of unknown function (DUF2017)
MGSVRRRGDRVRVSLESGEVMLLISLTTQVLELLGEGAPPDTSDESLEQLLDGALDPVEPPRDPALLRLLPDAYRDDSDAAGEFRRLTESDLRATKRSGLTQIVADLSAPGAAAGRGGGVRLDLDESAASGWLPALTDIRLTLGTRIGVTEDMDEERMELPVDSPRYAEIATYDWLSWLQDAMVRALIGE